MQFYTCCYCNEKVFSVEFYIYRSEPSGSDTVTYPVEESIFELMLSGPRPFITVIIIKPRAFKKHLAKVLKKLTQEGFKIVGLKVAVLDKETAQRLVPSDVTVWVN